MDREVGLTSRSDPPVIGRCPAPVGDLPFAVKATASSRLPMTFSVSASSAEVCTSGGTLGATITIVGKGTCTVPASQFGNANYAPAHRE